MSDGNTTCRDEQYGDPWTKYRLILRDGPACFYCGHPFSQTMEGWSHISIDHLFPQSKGKARRTSTTCLTCGSAASSATAQRVRGASGKTCRPCWSSAAPGGSLGPEMSSGFVTRCMPSIGCAGKVSTCSHRIPNSQANSTLRLPTLRPSREWSSMGRMTRGSASAGPCGARSTAGTSRQNGSDWRCAALNQRKARNGRRNFSPATLRCSAISGRSTWPSSTSHRLPTATREQQS